MGTVNWIVLGALAAVVAWAVWTYNRLVQRRNEIANAFAQIDVQLKRRHDLVPNLVEVARRTLAHERETLEAVTRARAAAVSAAGEARAAPADAPRIEALGRAEALLGGALGRLMAVVEAYPELQGDGHLRELAEEITHTENRVAFARQAFNDAVLEHNNLVQAVPDLLVARLGGFAPAAPLAATASEAERAAPRVAF